MSGKPHDLARSRSGLTDVLTLARAALIEAKGRLARTMSDSTLP